jgi:hypothetical protein
LPWSHRVGVGARFRNWAGNAAFEWIFSGVRRTINRQRRAWGLPAVQGLNGTFSGLAQVAQLPAALELPVPASRLPAHRPLGGPGRSGASGFPVVPPRPRPAAGVRLDGHPPERSPPDFPDDCRGVRGV